jgi:hypothetical protein
MKLIRFILLTFAIIIDGYAMSYLAKKIYVNSVEARVVKIICSFDNTHNYKTTYCKNIYNTNNEIIVCNTELIMK